MAFKVTFVESSVCAIGTAYVRGLATLQAQVLVNALYRLVSSPALIAGVQFWNQISFYQVDNKRAFELIIVVL